MAVRCMFESSSDIGVFAKLTNTYCIVGVGASENFYRYELNSFRNILVYLLFILLNSIFEGELAEHMPVVHATIADCRIVGRLSAGNRHGLLLPNSTTDQELQHIRNSLPDNVRIRRIEERLSALGNVITCNDYVALIHPDLDKVSD
jgi:translation initiation factor 6